ncbi:hypothetical protein [Phyllobacterium sp. SB3]|uniref:hypothetical protein n=1 Tax=Phyllobacterium sp. SB3 TaxID=3156073 RepID=UPI0032AF5CC3
MNAVHNNKAFDFDMFGDALKVKKADGRTKFLGVSNIDMTIDSGNEFLFVDWLDIEAVDEPWKSEGKIIYAKKLTKVSPQLTYIFVAGDADNQIPEFITIVHGGLLSLRDDDKAKVSWTPCNAQGLVNAVHQWVKRSQT